MATVLLILQGANLVGTLLPATVQAALDLKKLFEADPSTGYTAQLQVFQDGALKSAEDTIAIIDAWTAAHPV